MQSTPRTPSRAACLACRTRKIRCDGRNPCSRCSYKGLSCVYRPSRRGGIRRGANKPVTESPSQPPNLTLSPFVPPISASADAVEGDDLISISHLLSPLGGIRNLDVDVIDGSRHEDWSGVPASGNSACDPTGLLGSSHVPLRAYTSDEDILNAYYLHIHPFLSILPPPLSDQISDRPVWVEIIEVEKSSLPHWPASAFTLAISAILASIVLPRDSNQFTESRISTRRSAAQLFAEAAFREVDNEIDRISQVSIQTSLVTGPGTDVSAISPLSPVLALILLSIHEYCQRGNVSRMRSRANQAITAAMDIGLHSLGAAATEAQRRAWWSAMFVLFLSSIDHEASPIISRDDGRITTPYPSFHGQPELWPLLLQAEDAVLSVSQTLRNHNAHSTVESSSSSNISAKITRLDSDLSKLTRKLDRSPQPESGTGADTQGLQTMWAIAQALVYSARVRLHRVRAFSDIPLFFNNHCDLNSYQETRNLPQTVSSVSSAFPFTEAQSSLICLKTSLAMARAYERVAIFAEGGPTHIVLPFFMCGAMQASYVLLMIHYRLRVALRSEDQGSTYSHLLHQPEPGFEVQDTERLLRELRQGIDSILRMMRLAIMFEGVGGMGGEIQTAYHGVCAGEF